jgi:outer membrane protein assembly factor BamB
MRRSGVAIFDKISVLCAVSAVAVTTATGAFTATPAHAEWCHYVTGPVDSKGNLLWEGELCEGAPKVEPHYFTAVAVSDSTLAWGTSWAANTRAEAEQLALAQCRRYAADCRAVDWAQYKCLALAASDREMAWGVDAGNFPETASSKAVAACRSVGDSNCVVKTHPCSQD